MAYTISEACNACGACERCCFYEAIITDSKQYRIDPDKCKDCSICLDSCLRDAIIPPPGVVVDREP